MRWYVLRLLVKYILFSIDMLTEARLQKKTSSINAEHSLICKYFSLKEKQKGHRATEIGFSTKRAGTPVNEVSKNFLQTFSLAVNFIQIRQTNTTIQL